MSVVVTRVKPVKYEVIFKKKSISNLFAPFERSVKSNGPLCSQGDHHKDGAAEGNFF